MTKTTFKDGLSLKINQFPQQQKIVLRNKHACIMIKASYEGIWVEYERKINTTLVFLLSNCRNY